MENIKHINKYLKSQYGTALDGSFAKFRIAWSEDLFETRKGLFSELAIMEEIRTVPKYSYIKDKFILEVYVRAFPDVFGRSIEHNELAVLKSDGYEPLRVFRTRDNKYLPPDLEISKLICDAFIELVNRPKSQRLTEGVAANNEKQSIDSEVEKFFNILSMSDSDLLQQFKHKEAIILPGVN